MLSLQPANGTSMSSDLVSSKNYHHDPASGSSMYNGNLLPSCSRTDRSGNSANDPLHTKVAWLREAFPKVDENVIDVVLGVSGGLIEPAFHAQDYFGVQSS